MLDPVGHGQLGEQLTHVGLDGDQHAERRTLLHVITETATHAGHLDAARELIDGRIWLVLTE